MMGHEEFSNSVRFLQARRAAVSPTAVGLPHSGARRRVPGLRREEVAAKVGLSTDYYIRLEQGRGGRPSETVLEAIATALLLDDPQREHLRDLADPRNDRPRATREQLSAATRVLLDTMTMPALVMTAKAHVIGWDELACAVFTDFAIRERNTAWLLFRDAELAARHRNWEASARDTVGMLRMAAGRNPDDSELTAVVGELATHSSTFRRYWRHHVYASLNGLTQLEHSNSAISTSPSSRGQHRRHRTRSWSPIRRNPDLRLAQAVDLLGR